MSDEKDFNKTGARFEGKFLFREHMGQLIAEEGPGKGFASYPWALDKYERALGIAPDHAWLLHRMIKHYWKSGGEVHISMRKVCTDALISRSSLDKILRALLRMGYLTVVGRGRTMMDRRVRYDVSGIFNALIVAISCDPSSRYAEENDVGSVADWFKSAPEEWHSFTMPAQLNNWMNARGKRFNWAEGREEPLQTDGNGRAYKAICEECDEAFMARSPNAKNCPACRDAIRQERWQAFQRAYHEFEHTMEEEA